MKPSKEDIQKALSVLIGESLWASGRAADLQWFQFGKRRKVKTVRGGEKQVGEYALHIQCPWRITHGDHIVVGSGDLYYPALEIDGPQENFVWDVQGANRRDKRITELFQGENRQFLVKDIQADQAGRFVVVLDDDHALEVFPDDSLIDEHWRIFKPSEETPHFVYLESD